MVNRYTTFIRDIEPLGFEFVIMDGFLSKKAVQAVKEIMESPIRKEKIARKNYEIAARHFSYSVLQTQLNSILSNIDGQGYQQEFEESGRPMMLNVDTERNEPDRAGTIESWEDQGEADRLLKVAGTARL